MTELIANKDGVKAAYSDAIAQADWKRFDTLDALFDLFQFKGERDDFDVGDLRAIREERYALGSDIDGDGHELDAEIVGKALEALDRVLGTAIHE